MHAMINHLFCVGIDDGVRVWLGLWESSKLIFS